MIEEAEKRCGNCEFWGTDDGLYADFGSVVRMCQKIKDQYIATPDDLAMTCGDNGSSFDTRAEFGCVLFEPKAQVPK